MMRSRWFEAVVEKITTAMSVAILIMGCLCVQSSYAERVRDLATINGVRPNALFGYGLVVGLDGTGDQTTQTPFTTQSLQSMLGQLGVNLPPGGSLQLKNVASVMVTAQLPAFTQPGQNIDVTVSSIGNAKSLRGGTLLMTPLKGADGQVYALAQGQLIIGGAGASAGGSKTVINHLSAGRIPNGALVEKSVDTPFALSDTMRLELMQTDFSNANRVSEAINKRFGDGTAKAMDGRMIEVRAPMDSNARVLFISELEQLTIERSASSAKVIVNARTGSVVMNQAVTIAPCAVAHGNLSVQITSTPAVSQPNALAGGQTAVTQQTDIQIKQDGGNLIQLDGAAQLSDVVKALNSMGATPQDLVSILQAMQASGSLRAELEVI
jgi:flagellar P-ring protein precursor FlgI